MAIYLRLEFLIVFSFYFCTFFVNLYIKPLKVKLFKFIFLSFVPHDFFWWSKYFSRFAFFIYILLKSSTPYVVYIFHSFLPSKMSQYLMFVIEYFKISRSLSTLSFRQCTPLLMDLHEHHLHQDYIALDFHFL